MEYKNNMTKRRMFSFILATVLTVSNLPLNLIVNHSTQSASYAEIGGGGGGSSSGGGGGGDGGGSSSPDVSEPSIPSIPVNTGREGTPSTPTRNNGRRSGRSGTAVPKPKKETDVVFKCCNDLSNPRQKRVLEAVTLINVNEANNTDYRPSKEKMEAVMEEAQELRNADVEELRYMSGTNTSNKRPITTITDKQLERLNNQTYKGYMEYLINHSVINRDEVFQVSFTEINGNKVEIPRGDAYKPTGDSTKRPEYNSRTGSSEGEVIISHRKYAGGGSSPYYDNKITYSPSQRQILNTTGRYSRPTGTYPKTDFIVKKHMGGKGKNRYITI